MEIAVLHNPTAGDRDLPRQKLAALLRGAGYRPKFFSLKAPGWKRKNAFGKAEFVVVAGGDGSVRKAALQLHDRGLPLALLPLGTANNICTSLGIAGPLRKIIAGWSSVRRRKMDLGVVQGPWGEKLFVESVGVGLIGRAISIIEKVDATSEHRPERREDRLHRDVSVMQALAHELQPVSLAVAVDDGRPRSGDYLLLEIMNISRVGPGLELAPGADPSDGFLDVVSATVREREKLKRSLAGSIAGKKNGVTLTRQKARVVRIELHDGEFRLDDQVVLNCRRSARSRKKSICVDIFLRPRAFEVLIPAHPR